jgi:hypothetical protein
MSFRRLHEPHLQSASDTIFRKRTFAKVRPGRKPVPTRRFQAWSRSEVLRWVLTGIAKELHARGVLDEEDSFIDATFAMVKRAARSQRLSI